MRFERARVVLVKIFCWIRPWGGACSTFSVFTYHFDDFGFVFSTASHLPFGGVLTSSGAPIALRFPGQWLQSESGLHQNWMRDYDPTMGRYVQADPLGLVDGASVYNYVHSNPGRYVDPRGEFTLGDAKRNLERRWKPVTGGSSGWFSDEKIFDEWLRLEREKQEWLRELPDCPCRVEEAVGAGWFSVGPANPEHPGGFQEVRSRPTAGKHASQCIYDVNGDLMTDIPAAGSADNGYFDWGDPGSWYRHYKHDLEPWNAAKALGRRADYYDVRPIQ